MNLLIFKVEEQHKKKKDPKEKESQANKNDDNAFKGIENAIQEGNQDLINTLVMRKIKLFIQEQNIDFTQKNQNLKLQLKMMAESVVLRFKGLKHLVSEVFIQSQVEMAIDKLKIKRAQAAGELKKKPGITDDESSGIDYNMIESTLLTNFAQAVEECKALTSIQTELNQANLTIKQEIAQLHNQVRSFHEFCIIY